MLKHERIRRFACLKFLIPIWCDSTDLNRFYKLLKATKYQEEDILKRVYLKEFNTIRSIGSIRLFLEAESTHRWERVLCSKAIQEINDSTYRLYRKSLTQANWITNL